MKEDGSRKALPGGTATVWWQEHPIPDVLFDNSCPWVQVVVWGATGFTGKLVCEHIATDYQVRASRFPGDGSNTLNDIWFDIFH